MLKSVGSRFLASNRGETNKASASFFHVWVKSGMASTLIGCIPVVEGGVVVVFVAFELAFVVVFAFAFVVVVVGLAGVVALQC